MTDERAPETGGASRRGAVVAWSREQIEAYLRGDDLQHSYLRRALLIEREELVRLMPEAPDYRVLAREHFAGIDKITWNRETAADDEIRDGMRAIVANLWARSFSDEPVGEEAPEAAP